MYLMKILALQLFALLILSGCSSKDVYTNIQSNGKRECEQGPPAQYNECMTQYGESYESYKNSRDKLFKDSEKTVINRLLRRPYL